MSYVKGQTELDYEPPMNKMPDVPAGLLGWLTSYQKDLLQQHERACYLAGITAARGCVPEADARSMDNLSDRIEQRAHNACRATTLANIDREVANLDALAKEAAK